jgi:hypothetical protein
MSGVQIAGRLHLDEPARGSPEFEGETSAGVDFVDRRGGSDQQLDTSVVEFVD